MSTPLPEPDDFDSSILIPTVPAGQFSAWTLPECQTGVTLVAATLPAPAPSAATASMEATAIQPTSRKLIARLRDRGLTFICLWSPCTVGIDLGMSARSGSI